MALNESMKMKETSSSSDTNIFGFELMDIVLSESPFRFTERKVGRESGGWTNLARDVGYVLFCSGLGDAIMPGTGGNELCRNWSSLPSNFDYLAAYIPCLIDVLQRQVRAQCVVPTCTQLVVWRTESNIHERWEKNVIVKADVYVI